jgi:hypothetical protein
VIADAKAGLPAPGPHLAARFPPGCAMGVTMALTGRIFTPVGKGGQGKITFNQKKCRKNVR